MAVRRATLRLALACDNRCVFCAQRGLDGAALTPDELEPRLAELRRDHDELSFTGGEPTQVGWLPDAVSAARAAGFVAVGVQTHGRALAQADLMARLMRAGLTDVHVSVHGAKAAVHDYHTGVEGSLAGLSDGVAAARALGATVVATTLLTRSSFRTLAELPAWLSARGVSAWQVVVPRVAGEAAQGFDRVVPRLGMALPFALHAVDAALRRGLPGFVRGAPRCALGPFASRALADDAPRAFAPLCESCGARAECDGVDATYLERWGAGELTALHAASATSVAVSATSVAVGATGVAVGATSVAVRVTGAGASATAASATTSGATSGASATANVVSATARATGSAAWSVREHALARMFVGTGPLAPPAPVVAAKPRQLLPLAGKVQPARGEVTAAAPRKSGEALREILPELFPKR